MTLGTDFIIFDSIFENTGANAIFLQAKNVQVLRNTFRNNHKDAPFNINGGQVDFPDCGDAVAIFGNTVVDGPRTPNGWWADGIEGYATNMAVVDNVVMNNAGYGIGFVGLQKAYLANWDPSTYVGSNEVGVYIANSEGFRTVDTVTIDGVISVNNVRYGINIDAARTGVPIRRVVLTNNCVSGNGEPLFLRGLAADFINQNTKVSGCAPK